jgi:hypothetical protein
VSDRRVHPPSGMPPPTRSRLAGGRELSLPPLVETIADRYFELHPEELERYGSVGREWCVHDNLHLLNWAILDERGDTSLVAQVAWLANVLGARGFPLSSLRDDLVIASEVLRDTGDPDLAGPAQALEVAAGTVPLEP